MPLREAPARSTPGLPVGNAVSLDASTYTLKARANGPRQAPRQTRNVKWNQRDGVTFANVTVITRARFTNFRFIEFAIDLILGSLHSCLANTAQPTGAKTRKTIRFLTPTTPKALCFRINNIPGGGRLVTKPESPLESVKGGLHGPQG